MKITRSSSPENFSATKSRKNIELFEDYVEAINQVFALFRLNYHNQYYAAYPDAEQVKQIKKLWLESLTKYPVAVILQGAKQAIEHSDYLPTLSRMHQFCIDYLQQSLRLLRHCCPHAPYRSPKQRLDAGRVPVALGRRL